MLNYLNSKLLYGECHHLNTIYHKTIAGENIGESVTLRIWWRNFGSKLQLTILVFN